MSKRLLTTSRILSLLRWAEAAHKRCLVLDLDETLVHTEFNVCRPIKPTAPQVFCLSLSTFTSLSLFLFLFIPLCIYLSAPLFLSVCVCNQCAHQP